MDRVFPGPYLPVFGQNTWKYRPEKYPYLDTFHAVGNIPQKIRKIYSQLIAKSLTFHDDSLSLDARSVCFLKVY